LEEVADANAGSIQLLKQIIENPEETAELIEFGIIDEETAAKAEEIIEARDEVENWLREKLNELYQIERDLDAIKDDINRFRQTALADFYAWTSDSEDY
jgi:flagellar biosynthesis/type III secretory pathway ATPase